MGGLLEASWSVLEASWPVLRPSWASEGDVSVSRSRRGPSWSRLGADLARFKPVLGPEKPRDKPRRSPEGLRGAPGNAGSPRKIQTKGSEPFKNSSKVKTEAQGRGRGPENTPIRASRHGGGYATSQTVGENLPQSDSDWGRFLLQFGRTSINALSMGHMGNTE